MLVKSWNLISPLSQSGLANITTTYTRYEIRQMHKSTTTGGTSPADRRWDNLHIQLGRSELVFADYGELHAFLDDPSRATLPTQRRTSTAAQPIGTKRRGVHRSEPGFGVGVKTWFRNLRMICEFRYHRKGSERLFLLGISELKQVGSLG